MSDQDNTENGEDKLLYCSFCGKNQNEVRKLNCRSIRIYLQ
jgi:hypothetical protein